MKINFVPLTLITLLVMLMFSHFVTITAEGGRAISQASQGPIVIDGNVSDWTVSPVAIDPVGDTFQWSKNASILGVGATAEKPGMVTGNVTKNDMCRDLKALYFVAYNDTIYMRLDVAGLYPGWNNVSGHVTPWGVTNPPPPWPGLSHTNVSMHEIYFDLDPGGPEGHNVAAGADELNFSKGHQPDIYLEWDGTAAFISTMGQNPKYLWSVIIDNNNEIGITTAMLGGIKVAVDIAAGAFEFSFDRAMLESGVKNMLNFTEIGVVDVWAMSYKPGESSNTGWGMWRHLFDPQAPATHGEDIYSYAPAWPGTPDWSPVSEQYKPSGPWPPYTWTDPWGIGHNLTTSPATKGMNGINSVTGQPITLTYPVPIDYADTFSQTGNNLATFTFAPATPWDTKATLAAAAMIEVNLTGTGPAPKTGELPPSGGEGGQPLGLIIYLAAIAVLIVVPVPISMRRGAREKEKQ